MWLVGYQRILYEGCHSREISNERALLRRRQLIRGLLVRSFYKAKRLDGVSPQVRLH
jgi:hypothetical protein